MNKQYIFLTLVGIILYILYLIITFSIEEYKVSSNIQELEKFITETKQYNKDALEVIDYKQSAAYKNMILKEQQSLKNKGESVIYLTTQKNYNKFTQEAEQSVDTLVHHIPTYSITDSMTIPEKWSYYIFKKSKH